MRRFGAAIGLVLVLAGCTTPAPLAAPAARFSWADIQPIIVPITYRDVLGQKCRMPDARVKAAFMAELKSAGASPQLIAQSQAEAARIDRAERKTPKEYVCTAELFDSTEANAKAALKAWSDLKGRGS